MHQIDSQVRRVKGLPDSAYWQAVEASIELRRQEAAAARAHEEGARQLAREYAERFRSVVAQGRGGAKTLEKYLAHRKAHTAKLRAARRRMPLTFDGRREFGDLRSRMAAESASFVRQLGIETAQVKALREDVRKRKAALFEATIGKGEALPDVQRERAKNQTFTFPYDGASAYISSFKYESDPTDILPDPEAEIVTPQRSIVGAGLSASVKNASDNDWVTLLTRATVRKWFRMPSAGRVRMSGKYQESSQYALLSGKIVNEFGESEVDVIQGARLYVQVTSPVVSSRIYFMHWRRRDRTEDSHEWHDTFLDFNDVVASPQIVIPGTFAAGTWVLADFGLEQYNDFFSNDCEVYTFNGLSGLVPEIGLSSAG